jgi:hypothetical protein
MNRDPNIDHVPVFGELVSFLSCLGNEKEGSEVGLTICCNKDKHPNDESLYKLALE